MQRARMNGREAIVLHNSVTQLIEAAARGEAGASDELLPLVYEELRRLAHARMNRERPGQTLQATALVHEAYLRLVGSDTEWQNRRHFFAAAAETMRRILIERARRYAAVKHGGDLQRTDFDGLEVPNDVDVERLVAWDQLLDQLAEKDAVMADVVKLRSFAGFTVDETAQALELSSRSVNRQWSAAQAWLRVRLDRAEQGR